MKKNGGSAFPVVERQYTYYPAGSAIEMIAKTEAQDGMSLRDWFAGMALQGLYQHYRLDNPDTRGCVADDGVQSAVFRAYKIADAMIEQREKQ